MAAARADRLYRRFAVWLGRAVFLTVAAAVITFAGMLLLPSISWLPYTLAGFLFIAAFACLLVAVAVFIWWVIARRAFYQELAADRRQAVHQNELRNSGAPAW